MAFRDYLVQPPILQSRKLRSKKGQEFIQGQTVPGGRQGPSLFPRPEAASLSCSGALLRGGWAG